MLNLSKIAPNTFAKQSLKIMSLIPLNKRWGKKYWEIKNLINKAQWWSKAEIEKWQSAKLQEILSYAYKNVPGYHQLYNEAQVNIQDVRQLSDIKILPFVTKHILQDNIKDFTSRNLPQQDLLYVTTGGSTGIPFGFYHTNLNFSVENAFMHSGWERVGWKLGDESVVIRGEYIGSEQSLWAYNHYKKELHLSLYYLTPKTYKNYLAKLSEKLPPHLQAYPSAAAVLADLVIENHDEGKLPFKTLFLASENMYDWQATRIQQAFPIAKIFSWYGHAEQTIMAHMCEKSTNYHLWPFYGHTEILNDSGEDIETGESGELVGTSFWNYGTPFIRYKTMDIAKKGNSSCEACGRQFQLINNIDGRLQEVIVTKSGRYISMTAINMHDDIFDNLKQFQFLQEKAGKVTFRFVPKNGLTAEEIELIKQRLMPKLGEDMLLSMEKVDAIPTTGRGKHKFLEQKLDIKYGDR